MSRTRVLLVAASLLSLSLVACGDDDGPTDAGGGADADVVLDAGRDTDAGLESDAGSDVDPGDDTDAGIEPDLDAGSDVDAGTEPDLDAGTTPDAGSDPGRPDAGPRDAGGACHAYDFGAEAVPLRMAPSLPTMTGGTIPLGIYDAVDAQLVGGLTGSFRATWVFEDATTLHQIQQITLAGAGDIVPRTFAWSTAGATLTRSGTCPDSASFTQEYRVREEGGVTYLDVRQTNLLFTFRRR